MGKDLAAAFPVARGIFGEVDAALGTDLSRLCFEGPADQLTATKNAQPALLAHGAAVWTLVKDALFPHVRAAAGHSLGEFTAYHAADTVSLPGAARLVRRRGELMFDTGIQRPGTMAAILGITSTPIEEICTRATKEAGLVVPANYNTDEQTVISGEIAGVERAMELALLAQRLDLRRLQVRRSAFCLGRPLLGGNVFGRFCGGCAGLGARTYRAFNRPRTCPRTGRETGSGSRAADLG